MYKNHKKTLDPNIQNVRKIINTIVVFENFKFNVSKTESRKKTRCKWEDCEKSSKYLH